MAAPLGVLRPKRGEALSPVGQRAPVELRLESVEERVQAGQEPARRLSRDPPVGDQQVGRGRPSGVSS